MSQSAPPFILFTDFTLNGPYVGQMKAVLTEAWAPVIDLMHDAPAFDPRASAYLLRAFAAPLPRACVIVAVVDPGVGTERGAVAIRAAQRWLIGPDNGLLAPLARESSDVEVFRLAAPAEAAATFHGRDVFAPAAVDVATGAHPSHQHMDPAELVGWDWPNDEARVIYIDGYGNVMTGIRGNTVPQDARLVAGKRRLARGQTFADVDRGQAFWYINSSGLLEIAVNQGSAAEVLGLEQGSPVALEV